MRINDTAWEKGDEHPDTPPAFTHNYPFHGWLYGRKCRNSPAGAKYRLFGHARGLGFDRNAASAGRMGGNLLEVSTIQTFVLRRQFYRAFSASRGFVKLFRSLPGLEDFIYEPWRGPPRRLRGLDGIPAVRNTSDKPYAELLNREKARFMRDFDHEHFFSKMLGDRSSLKRISTRTLTTSSMRHLYDHGLHPNSITQQAT